MSMTMKNLVSIFKSGSDDYHGISLVVEALREPIEFLVHEARNDVGHIGDEGVYLRVNKWINEILGSDAGSEKAAGASARKDEGQDNGCITPASPKPAADPKDGSMTALVEKVARAIIDAPFKDEQAFTSEAKAAIRAVLTHFSEPGNVTVAMINARQGGYGNSGGTMVQAEQSGIAAAMRAALEEMKR